MNRSLTILISALAVASALALIAACLAAPGQIGLFYAGKEVFKVPGLAVFLVLPALGAVLVGAPLLILWRAAVSQDQDQIAPYTPWDALAEGVGDFFQGDGPLLLLSAAWLAAMAAAGIWGAQHPIAPPGAPPPLSPVQAGLMALAGLGVIYFGAQLVARLREGETIAFANHFGGIGSGLGGWRVSTLAAALILTLASVLVLGAVAMAGPGRAEKSPPPAAAGKSAKPAADKPGPAQVDG